MKITFRKIRMSPANKARLAVINQIIEEYRKQGYVLTLRQLYYQLVSRDVVPNNVKEYKKLSGLLREGRMAGIVDWAAIEDRLRIPESPNSWDTPQDAIQTIVDVFALKRQDGQPVYMEVWVEKDALSGVLERVTRPYHVPIMVNRGYSSASAMFGAYERFEEAYDRSQSIKVIYLGDFDPSGKDMIRDIEERICEFVIGRQGGFEGNDEECGDELLSKRPGDWKDFCLKNYAFDFEIIPIALTREQIKQYSPPPNPAKLTDPRAKDYIAEFGDKSWEVDALRPEILNSILTQAIERFIDRDMFDDIVAAEKPHLKKLRLFQEQYDTIKLVEPKNDNKKKK